MNHETLEQAAAKYKAKAAKDLLWGLDGGAEITPQKCLDWIEKDFIAGASWREQQAASGFSEYIDQQNKEEDPIRPYNPELHAWQASALNSAKLLAEKDAIIKILSDERTHVSILAHEKEIAEKDAEIAANDKREGELKDRLIEASKSMAKKDAEIERLVKDRDDWVDNAAIANREISQAKELIKEMREALVFYGDEKSYSERIIHQDGAFSVRCTLDDDFDCIEPAQKPFFNPNLYGGKLARKTLNKNAEKIKALLGE